eukprot:CAMPEP_0203744310 /NCGR_PEP_ID=MMETSP0098-20131031/427_1 /ASSEMBLY_ACC=CAM_ASM_000208 /TAXON_ID=96639 /ORGANISM=" , Strain NY0313808BC1" /LENGTH=440 /DNA_ID=CAMNT_0050631803 /DNA_START=263 /DNA_END=1585 /DNA_ORIENTATION=+
MAALVEDERGMDAVRSRLMSREFALALDAGDELKCFREQFHMPKSEDGSECVYLCGNSLGLQPKKAQDYVMEEMTKWAQKGVEGHFCDVRPWVTVDELCRNEMAAVVGAQVDEVATMNSLTMNLHVLLISFYRPTATRNKILIEAKAFPSDFYAVRSQVMEKGYNPDECVVLVSPRPGEETIRTEDIEALVEKHKDELAVVMLSGIQYYTGQVFEMEKITKFVKRITGEQCKVGFDLAHAVGNVILRLHDWNVDFACWCTYKYLNSGPGGVGGIFVHSRHGEDETIPKLCGWWGHRKEDRFKMKDSFTPSKGAFSWQVSNPCVLPLATLRASLELFGKAGMPAIREKSVALTRYLEILLDLELPSGVCKVITPSFDRLEERGAQLSLVFSKPVKVVHEKISKEGVICDLREPDVMRIAPCPLYNTFTDVYRFVHILKSSL